MYHCLDLGSHGCECAKCGHRVVTLCGPVGRYHHRFGGRYRLYLQGEAEILVTTYKTTLRYYPENHNRHLQLLFEINFDMVNI